ncbi:hypothetical protein FRC14_000985 [Serendipita sp. 396]|nr:hypothetical protein FRC14_000985 [Serendipita sp. 396]KAG8789005.1 hypothetical protein FRC15_000552 [Serendipita sp. 397]KAG8876677.1 hypothetical protein FRC20_001015 [Serendipita sp. 405]
MSKLSANPEIPGSSVQRNAARGQHKTPLPVTLCPSVLLELISSLSTTGSSWPKGRSSDRSSIKKRKRVPSDDSEPPSAPHSTRSESTRITSVYLGYEEPSPLTHSGVLANPPTESPIPSLAALQAPRPHDHPVDAANANAEHQDTIATTLSSAETLAAILSLLFRRMGAVDDEEYQRMRDWFQEQERVKYWKANKPLGCAACYMPVKNVRKMAKHLYRAHSPYRNPSTKLCCGCVFSSQEKLEKHVNRDHSKRLIRLDHSDYTDLSDGALKIAALDEPHFSLVESLTGNTREAKGRMLNLIAVARPHNRPLMVFKRKHGITVNNVVRVNNAVSMVCCGICATPRSNVQEMALHFNSVHLEHKGFDCPQDNCGEKFRAFDGLKRHAATHKLQLKKPKVKIDPKRRSNADLNVQEDESNQMKTNTGPAGTNRMSVTTTSSSSTSSLPPDTSIQPLRERGGASQSVQQQRKAMGEHPIVDHPPSHPSGRQGPVNSHVHWLVQGQQPDLMSIEQPSQPPDHSLPAGPIQSPNQQDHLDIIMGSGEFNGYTAPHLPSHPNYVQPDDAYIASQQQNHIGLQPHLVDPPQIQANAFLEQLSICMNDCPHEIVQHVLSNPTDVINGEPWGQLNERQRAVFLLFYKGIKYSRMEMQGRVRLEGNGAIISPTVNATFPLEYNLLMSPNTLEELFLTSIDTGYAASPPTAVTTPQDNFQDGVASGGSGMQAGDSFDFFIYG